jgi:uncharacterized protein
VVRIDWHEPKRQANIEKHGIDFADLGPVFEAPMLVTVDPRRNRSNEVRFVGIGRLNRRTLTMVWAEHRNIRWIISARRANAKERAEYDAAGW